jgi:hypothetical protein
MSSGLISTVVLPTVFWSLTTDTHQNELNWERLLTQKEKQQAYLHSCYFSIPEAKVRESKRRVI